MATDALMTVAPEVLAVEAPEPEPEPEPVVVDPLVVVLPVAPVVVPPAWLPVVVLPAWVALVVPDASVVLPVAPVVVPVAPVAPVEVAVEVVVVLPEEVEDPLVVEVVLLMMGITVNGLPTIASWVPVHPAAMLAATESKVQLVQSDSLQAYVFATPLVTLIMAYSPDPLSRQTPKGSWMKLVKVVQPVYPQFLTIKKLVLTYVIMVVKSAQLLLALVSGSQPTTPTTVEVLESLPTGKVFS